MREYTSSIINQLESVQTFSFFKTENTLALASFTVFFTSFIKQKQVKSVAANIQTESTEQGENRSMSYLMNNPQLFDHFFVLMAWFINHLLYALCWWNNIEFSNWKCIRALRSFGILNVLLIWCPWASHWIKAPIYKKSKFSPLYVAKYITDCYIRDCTLLLPTFRLFLLW